MRHRPFRGPVGLGGLPRTLPVVGRTRSVTARLPASLPSRGLRDKHPRVEAETGRLFLPTLPERFLVDVALVRAGHQRRALGETLIPGSVAETARFHRCLDLGAPRRERLDGRARYARDLEAPVGMGLLDAVADLHEPPRQFAPVHGADQHLRGVEPLVGHRAPLAVLAPDHVGEHAMRVKLRIEVAGSVVAERIL